MAFEFKNQDVAKKYAPVDVSADFKLRVPQANWPATTSPGYFSDITPAVAEQLIKEGYNRIKKK